jgi:hypothetical protein
MNLGLSSSEQTDLIQYLLSLTFGPSNSASGDTSGKGSGRGN